MKEKLRILLLEDNEKEATLIKSSIEEGGVQADIVNAKNKNTYLDLIGREKFDLIISDYNIPQFNGLNSLLEAKKKNKNIPFIFVSNHIGEEKAVQCIQHGATDFILKDNLNKLVPAINHALQHANEIKKEQQLENELAILKLAIDNSSEAIFMTNASGTIIYINSAFTKFYGWRADEVVNRVTPRILKSGYHNNEFYNQLWNQIKQNAPFTAEMINKTKDGKFIEIKNVINPVLDKRKNVLGYVAIQIDITLRKEHEREIIKAKNQIEEINNLKSYFLSNISHEIRTPLVSILGFAEILMEELLENEIKELVKYVYDSAKRLKSTIDNILTLQNLEKGKIDTEFQKVELVHLIKSVAQKFNEAINKKGLHLKFFIESNEIWIKSYPDLLEKIFSNIIDNAIKFTNKGGISIGTSLIHENEKPFALVKIADSGIGIEKEKIEQIFNNFRQASEGFSRAYEGMGLGLSISKQLIEQLNGSIKIYSKIGKGTLIVIKLPALPIEKEIIEQVNFEKSKITESSAPANIDRPLVLLVEDNDGNRLILKRYLEKNYIVEEARDGISAIAMAEIKHYDLILMDIHLGPGIDGIETFNRIRKLSNYNNIPIVAVTAFSMKDDRKKFLEQGFTDYIQKPVTKMDLINCIENLLSIRK